MVFTGLALKLADASALEAPPPHPPTPTSREFEHVARLRKMYEQNQHGAAKSKLVVWTLFLLINGF